MDLICNELSFIPLANNSHELEARFISLMGTFKCLREKYGFLHMRFPLEYNLQKVTTTETYYEWVSTLTNRKLQALLLDLCKKPYYDDLEDEELNIYCESKYEVSDKDVPTTARPIGLPISIIKSLPAISIHSHDFWLRRKINLVKMSDFSAVFAYNICLDTDIKSKEMIEWVDSFMSLKIANIESLRKYLSFEKFAVEFTQGYWEQLMEWKAEDVESFKYTLLLMKDVEVNPFVGGMGQTENLKNRGKEASKRININDRLSYTVDKNIVNFIACKGHYEFH